MKSDRYTRVREVLKEVNPAGVEQLVILMTIDLATSCIADTRQLQLVASGVSSESNYLGSNWCEVDGCRSDGVNVIGDDALVDEHIQTFHDSMAANNIDNNLKYFTSKTHIGGTAVDYEQAVHIRDLWRSQGLDEVVLNRYNVFLSQPEVSSPNKVYLLDEAGTVQFASSSWEDEHLREQGEWPAFLAFSPSGDVTKNELVYANYGREEDFELLAQMGVSVRERLVLVRFGAMFRGNKVLNAQKYGAAGVIIYTDPADYSSPENHTLPYPDSFWLPETGIQRGTVTWLDGDPLTYGYPATDWAYRNATRPTANMPERPCHSISAADARHLLQALAGQEAPAAWQGGLRDVTYRVGPHFINPAWSVRLNVNNKEEVLPTYNVLGFVRGSVEPDRYVILGNHRDAWTFGALDPSSATATLMEIARVFGEMRQSGWQPRRSILLGSWGCGEYGYYGVNELVEEYVHLLKGRTVAHLNVDLAIVYTYNLLVVASPSMHNVTIEAAKKVSAPDPALGFTSLYDHWRTRQKGDLFSYDLGSPSEHWPFYQQLGTPVVYTMWEIDFERWQWNDYPLYHSGYETYSSMRYLDPEYRYHLALGRLWGVLALMMAETPLLPIDVRNVSHPLHVGVQKLHAKYREVMKQHGVTLDSIEQAIINYERTAQQFHCSLREMKSLTDLEVRMWNDQLVSVEKSFIDPNALQEDHQNKNAIFGTNQYHEYEGVLYPDVLDTLIAAVQRPAVHERWERVRRAVAAAAFVINAASAALKRPTQFLREQHSTLTTVC